MSELNANVSYLNEKIGKLINSAGHAQNFVYSVDGNSIKSQHKKICIYEELLQAEFVLLPALNHLERYIEEDIRKDMKIKRSYIRKLLDLSDAETIPPTVSKRIMNKIVDDLRSAAIHAKQFLNSVESGLSQIDSESKKLCIYEELIKANTNLQAAIEYIQENLPTNIIQGYNRI